MYPVAIWLSSILQEEWWGHPKNGVVVGHSMFAKLSYPVKIAKVINKKKKKKQNKNEPKEKTKQKQQQTRGAWRGNSKFIWNFWTYLISVVLPVCIHVY